MDASRPGLSALHRPLRRPGRARRLGSGARPRWRGRYQFDRAGLDALAALAARRQSIVFSGLSESGVSDLYRVTLPDGTLEPLTSRPLSGSRSQPQSRRAAIVFASDRTADGIHGAANLFLLDLGTARITQLTRAAGAMNPRLGDPTAGSTSPPTAMACSTSFRWIRWARAGGRPRHGPARLMRCRSRATRAAGRRLSRPELEPLPLSHRLRRAGGHVRGGDRGAGRHSGPGRSPRRHRRPEAATRRALPPTADARFRRRRSGVRSRLRRRAGALLRHERPARRQPPVRFAVARSRDAGWAASCPTSAARRIYLNRSRRVNWGMGRSAPRAGTSRPTRSSRTRRPRMA